MLQMEHTMKVCNLKSPLKYFTVLRSKARDSVFRLYPVQVLTTVIILIADLLDITGSNYY